MEEQLRRAVVERDLPTVRQIQLRGAATQGDLLLVQRILQQPGVDVNAGYQDGQAALHLAVVSGHLATVQAVLQAVDVNVNARTETGYTPLNMANRATEGNRLQVPIIQALLEAGADPNEADNHGDTPLSVYIITLCPISTVEALLNRGATPAARYCHIVDPTSGLRMPHVEE